MRIYVIYLLAALLSLYLLMFYYGISSGFASPIPIFALVGTLVLSAGAPLLVYQPRFGLLVGALGCALLLPYSVMFAGGVLLEWRWHWMMPLALLPAMLVFVSSYYTVQAWRQRLSAELTFPEHLWLKWCLILLPILLWGSYFFSIRTAFS